MIHACQPPLDDVPCSTGSGVVACPRVHSGAVDGSHTPGLEDRRPELTLLIAAADATGTVAQAAFRATEDTRGYLMLLDGLVRRRGSSSATTPLLACTAGRKSPPRASSNGVGQAIGRTPTAGSRTDERRLLPDSVNARRSFSVSLFGGR